MIISLFLHPKDPTCNFLDHELECLRFAEDKITIAAISHDLFYFLKFNFYKSGYKKITGVNRHKKDYNVIDL